jgi:hypothetical protein
VNPVNLVLSLDEAALVLTALRGSESAGCNTALDGIISDLQTLVNRAENPDADANEDCRDAEQDRDEDYWCDDHQYCPDQF